MTIWLIRTLATSDFEGMVEAGSERLRVEAAIVFTRKAFVKLSSPQAMRQTVTERTCGPQKVKSIEKCHKFAAKVVPSHFFDAKVRELHPAPGKLGRAEVAAGVKHCAPGRSISFLGD